MCISSESGSRALTKVGLTALVLGLEGGVYCDTFFVLVSTSKITILGDFCILRVTVGISSWDVTYGQVSWIKQRILFYFSLYCDCVLYCCMSVLCVL